MLDNLLHLAVCILVIVSSFIGFNLYVRILFGIVGTVLLIITIYDFARRKNGNKEA